MRSAHSILFAGLLLIPACRYGTMSVTKVIHTTRPARCVKVQPASPDSVIAELSRRDIELRKEKAERDYAIETLRKIDRLGPGEYALQSTAPSGSFAVHASVTHPEVTPPLWLISSTYYDDSGMTMRSSEPLTVRKHITDPRELFDLLDGNVLVPARDVFELREGLERIRETPYALILKVKKKSSAGDLGRYRVKMNWYGFKVDGSTSGFSPRLDDRSSWGE